MQWGFFHVAPSQLSDIPFLIADIIVPGPFHLFLITLRRPPPPLLLSSVHRSLPSTFLQVGDPLVERGEGGLHSAALLRLVAESGLPLLDAVHPGQHLLLQVVDFTLEQVFEAVRLH